jgi:hypothetical protein
LLLRDSLTKRQSNAIRFVIAANLTVIPAKAGIHFALTQNAKIKMGPGFRRDDGGASAATR